MSNKASVTEYQWLALAELRWRAPMEPWAGRDQPTPVLEQRWQQISTGRRVWRPVTTLVRDDPVDDPVVDVASVPIDPSLAMSANLIVNDMVRMRLAIDDIRPHVDAWIALLEAHIRSLPDDSGADRARRFYAEHELDIMRRALGTLIALPRD